MNFFLFFLFFWKIFSEMNIFPNISRYLKFFFDFLSKKSTKIEKSKKIEKVEKSKNKKCLVKSQNSELNWWNLYIRVLNLSAGK